MAASPAAIAEAVTPPNEMPPPAQTAPAAVAETQSANVAAEAARPHIAAAQKPASASPMVVKLQLAELRNPRFTKTAVLAGCVAAGIVALALTAFDPVQVFLGDEASLQIAIPTPPAPPVRTEGLSQPALSLPAESKPAVTGDAADRSSNTSAPNTVSASNRPSRDPSTAAPANRQQLRMALPLPRASNPAAAAAAVPDIPAAPMVLPAAPLMEVPALVGSLSDAPQPTNPSAGAEYRPPEVLSRVEPVYSAMARQSRLQGTVRVNATIGVDGVPYSLVCVGGNSVLCQMAFQAIAKWRFQPATSNGQPVTAQTLISFNFQLR
jgi:TonB family protein